MSTTNHPGAGRPALPVSQRLVNRTLRLRPALVRRLEAIAKAKGTTVSALTAEVLARYANRSKL